MREIGDVTVTMSVTVTVLCCKDMNYSNTGRKYWSFGLRYQCPLWGLRWDTG